MGKRLLHFIINDSRTWLSQGGVPWLIDFPVRGWIRCRRRPRGPQPDTCKENGGVGAGGEPEHWHYKRNSQRVSGSFFSQAR